MKKVQLIRPDTVRTFRLAPLGEAEAVLTGRFRPMPAADVDALRRAVEADRGRRVPTLAARLAPHVVSWDADGPEPSAAAVAALPGLYLDGLELVVCGYAPAAEDGDCPST